jgi:uncharacterized membrane protein YdjX (TVP38/TMEM64 family)
MDDTPPKPQRLTKGRIVALVLFVVAVAAVFASGATHYLSLSALSENRARLLAFVEAHGAAAVASYMAVYVVAVALSLPGAVWLSIAGGFMFGTVLSTIYTVIAATIGAVIVFLLARYVIGDVLRARTGAALQKMEQGFRANALSYLLVLRLVPLFPFFLVNLVPAFLGVPLATFVVGTFFGIIPGSLVFAAVGAGLGDALAAGAEINPTAALKQPTVIGALAGLVVLSLIPVLYRKVKARG